MAKNNDGCENCVSTDPLLIRLAPLVICDLEHRIILAFQAIWMPDNVFSHCLNEYERTILDCNARITQNGHTPARKGRRTAVPPGRHWLFSHIMARAARKPEIFQQRLALPKEAL